MRYMLIFFLLLTNRVFGVGFLGPSVPGVGIEYIDREIELPDITIETPWGRNMQITSRDIDREETYINMAFDGVFLRCSEDGFGGGYKTVFCENWFLTSQTNYVSFDIDRSLYSSNRIDAWLSGKVDVIESYLSAGPAFQVSKCLSVYGGPFLRYTHVDMKLSGIKHRILIHGSSNDDDIDFGGFIGMSVCLDRINFNVEYAGDVLGFRLVYRF